MSYTYMLLSFLIFYSLCAPYSFFVFFFCFWLAAAQMAVAVDAEFKGKNTCLYFYPLPLLLPAPTALHDRS